MVMRLSFFLVFVVSLAVGTTVVGSMHFAQCGEDILGYSPSTGGEVIVGRTGAAARAYARPFGGNSREHVLASQALKFKLVQDLRAMAAAAPNASERALRERTILEAYHRKRESGDFTIGDRIVFCDPSVTYAVPRRRSQSSITGGGTVGCAPSINFSGNREGSLPSRPARERQSVEDALWFSLNEAIGIQRLPEGVPVWEPPTLENWKRDSPTTVFQFPQFLDRGLNAYVAWVGEEIESKGGEGKTMEELAQGYAIHPTSGDAVWVTVWTISGDVLRAPALLVWHIEEFYEIGAHTNKYGLGVEHEIHRNPYIRPHANPEHAQPAF